MIVITEDRKEAAEVKAACEIQETAASEQAAVAGAIAADAQKDLDEALPALEVAVKCLKSLKLSHLQEIKALANPPGGVKLALEVICIMFLVKPVMVADPDKPGKKIADYWKPSQTQVLNDPKKLLDDLFKFDKDNIPEKVITQLGPYMEREDYNAEAIKKSSVACEALCLWARAMNLKSN